MRGDRRVVAPCADRGGEGWVGGGGRAPIVGWWRRAGVAEVARGSGEGVGFSVEVARGRGGGLTAISGWWWRMSIVGWWRRTGVAEVTRGRKRGWGFRWRRLAGVAKASCEKLIIEKEDIAKGLEDIIALHGVTKLVMGALADKHYSKKMNTPKSKTALRLMEATYSSYQNVNGHPERIAIGSVDSWDEFGRTSQNYWYDSSRNGEAVSISGSATRQLTYEPDDDHFASRELNPSGDADIYGRLQEALHEAHYSKKEAYKESIKRRHIEINMLSALQKVKEVENLYNHEIKHREIIEETCKIDTGE
ncbi:hypothetical protein GUJ93_ZPchr0005g15006 [Zizania palustris]|uniref:Uncharacterized protein n=1 Tax=Zizania palustris TaxID=103762 RepID=A0A8J5SCV3_ZIZPA|nr:hypothetical protein GUJ93_ZPchr0005g15006 [Zizania palustris]